MRWQDFKIHVVAVSMLVALAAFFGAQWLYTSLNFQQPLKKELDSNQQIINYQIKEKDAVYTIVVTLRETADLRQTYCLINERMQDIMGKRPFIIELDDRRNERLTDVYNKGQFAIHEAMVKGNFREMSDSMNQYARASGVQSKVYIDSDNIYWQMKDEAYFLYAVIPRGEWAVNVQERGANDA
ncbi:hypothetical protein SPSYN_02381 [Sporotomaculum syntrophicum]|uniref:Uncharacterized protein n=1 Tax=Sporotomaculum syntrophicum TaxID=182264 RepID=A0A9D2WPB6_9FIRM|nr:hypothetical protein [Sporotomaculum syntrophicum]KAF1084603.1 hypothetical protein SPSYN_02381 [Sporotomaculum syntrophicum]